MANGGSVVSVPGKSGDAPTAPSRDESAPVPPSPSSITGDLDETERNSSFHPGALIAGKYVVERLIGEGGLGVVVSARNVQLDQTVAIKYLRPKALATKAVAERFLREARLAARIRSEHIVHVYDIGTLPDGAPYMVMEHLAGMDLGRMLSANGPFPVERAVDYVLQACEALAEAHAAGIVHRDIKPDNLFIATSPGGTPVLKVLDFGISKASAKRSAAGFPELTEAGDQFGTPTYMSPEQLLASGNVDARTDVWGIGVVLYELLTSALPFDGDSLPELCTSILHKPPTPLFLARPDLPLQLQAVVERCLAKDVEGRFQNVAELAQELRPFAGPAGRERIEQVIRVTLGAGDYVRPSTPAPGPSSVDALREVLTIAEPVERSIVTTGSGVASWAPKDVAKSVSGRDRVRLAVLGAAVVAVGVAVAALTGASSRPTAARPEGTSVSVANAVSPQPETPRATPALSDPPVPPPETPPVASASTAPVTVPVSRKGGPRHTAKAADPGAPKGVERPSHADQNAIINPFE